MTGCELARRLHEGDRVFGTAILSPSPLWPPVVASLGLDFVFIDTEHVPLDRQQLSWMCRAYSALNIPPIVRIPRPDPIAACQVLDGGAMGVIAPYVETPEQVRELVGAVKHKPIKGRVLQERLSGRTGPPGLDNYLAERNANNLLVINVESVPAMEALDALLTVPGLDALLIGPHDLTCSLGVPEQYDHPDFEAAVRRIVTSARAAGIGAGVHFIFDNMEFEQRMVAAGVNMIVHQSDFQAFAEKMRRDLETLRDTPPADGTSKAPPGATNI